MKLYEYKTKYITKLALLKNISEREKQLRDILITKLNSLRSMTLPNLVHTLYLIIEHENVSEKFKQICRDMLEDISSLEG